MNVRTSPLYVQINKVPSVHRFIATDDTLYVRGAVILARYWGNTGYDTMTPYTLYIHVLYTSVIFLVQPKDS